MPYVIGISLIIITLVIIGLILRKRIYDTVDRQENWKMDIMSRNTAEQLGRVKSLNLSGETQEKFESWKERWEQIITKDLPDVEENLFDAEDAADRYRFSTAKKIVHKVDSMLESIEHDIERMLQELEELLNSEETSRKEIKELQPYLKSLQTHLLNHGYQYGKARHSLDKTLDELDKKLSRYDELVVTGDYLEAKQLVDQLKLELDEIAIEIEEFPEIFKLVKDTLPDQLSDLLSGIKDMKEEGYRVDHLGFEQEIKTYQQRLKECMTILEKGSSIEIKPTIEEISERIQEMYDLLEKEAIAKSYLESKIPSYQTALSELGATFVDTQAEVELLRKTYYFEDSDMEKYMSLEKSMTKLRNQLEEMYSEMDDDHVAHTDIRAKLESGFEQLESVEQLHEAFKDQIYNLRKDELKAREDLNDIKQLINDIKRKLKKSNIPGVPNFIWRHLEKVADRNNQVIKTLESQPLDMAKVQHALSEARKEADTAMEQTNIVLEQAYLTEQVIQYANRYRSSHPELAEKLKEAERLFRNYEYELSLEHAAKAVEAIEPGALKRIEAYQEAL